ncbi:MAG: alpha/beta hydrolase [Desulfopila sp.]|jgi:pimeloyl-ACP methyl ester carboxylesterase|nr:alpha/beta hydrolase [Desulfopila sp.]
MDAVALLQYRLSSSPDTPTIHQKEMPHHTSGLSIFLLRGLAREVRHWGVFVEKLNQARSNINVIPLEMPGAGVLRDQKSPLRAGDYIPIIRQQYLCHVKAGQPAIIIGLSFGGMLAAQWVATHPEDFMGIVLINSSSHLSFPTKRLTPGGTLTFLRILFSRDSLSRERILAGTICNLADVEKTALFWKKIEDSAPMSPTNKIRQLYAAATFALPQLSRIPALVLCSKNDKLVSHSCSLDIAQAWKSDIRIHPTAGHDLTTDDSGWCIENLFPWIDDIYADKGPSSPHRDLLS